MTKIFQCLNSIFYVYYGMIFLSSHSGFRTHSGSHWCPCVTKDPGQSLQSFGSLCWITGIFPKSKLTSAVIFQEHSLWSFHNVQEYHNLKVVRGWLKYILLSRIHTKPAYLSKPLYIYWALPFLSPFETISFQLSCCWIHIRVQYLIGKSCRLNVLLCYKLIKYLIVEEFHLNEIF